MDNDIREKIIKSGYDYVKPFHDMLILLSSLDDEFEEHGSFDIVDCGGDPLGIIDELLASGLVSLARDGRTRYCEIYKIKK